VVLEPATMDDMCAGQAALEKPSLEVVYEGT
jgi:hypothetical protein